MKEYKVGDNVWIRDKKTGGVSGPVEILSIWNGDIEVQHFNWINKDNTQLEVFVPDEDDDFELPAKRECSIDNPECESCS